MRNTPAAGDFVRDLAPALRQAASIARALEGRVANRPKHGEVRAEKAALTIADTACQETLLVPLFEHFPNVRVAAEEDTPSVHRFPTDGDAVAVIDPIDGTLRFYLEGGGPYAVMMGLAVAGAYEAALLALPREELYFAAVRGAGATLSRQDESARPVACDGTGRRVLVSHDLPESARARLRHRGLEVAPASGGAIAVAPLLPGVRAGLRLAREVPTGVSIRGRIGALISAEAGVLVCTEEGAPFPREIERPARALLVATDHRDLEVLREAVAAVRP